VFKKSRFVLSIGLVVALGAGTLAYADGASENTAFVDGSVKPKKLDKKKYKPVSLFSGVRTETNITGLQQNPAVEYISYGKNVKFDLNAPDLCSTLPPNGSTPEQAKAACPPKSYLGQGVAAVQAPGGAPPIDDLIVSVFAGPAKGGIQLHTYSPTLGQASPTVPGSIVKSNAGSKYGQALSVPNAPETGALMITKFNATIDKKSKTVLARCKAKEFLFQRKVTYKDGSTETAELKQSCKRKKSN
jgi:hypothetical protein